MTTATANPPAAQSRLEATAALTAWTWATRSIKPARAWFDVAHLFGLAAHDSPAIRELGVTGYLDAVSGVSSPSLPGIANAGGPLLVNDTLTDLALEILFEHLGIDVDPSRAPDFAAIGAAAEETIQRRVFRSMRADGDPNRYTRLRRTLIEYPAGDRRTLATAWNAAGGRVDVYCELSPNATCRGWWVSCPRCRWPMNFTATTVACMLDRDRAKGANFSVVWSEGRPELTALTSPARGEREAGAFRTSVPQRADDVVAVSFGVWRYIVVPGVVEINLAAELERTSHAAVTLWPELDAYDLDIRVDKHRWCVDVKDWRSATLLAADLTRNPPQLPTASAVVHPRIVVPHGRRSHLPTLKQLVPPGVKVCTDRQLLTEIAAAVRA